MKQRLVGDRWNKIRWEDDKLMEPAGVSGGEGSYKMKSKLI